MTNLVLQGTATFQSNLVNAPKDSLTPEQQHCKLGFDTIIFPL